MRHVLFLTLALSILSFTGCSHNISKKSLSLVDHSVTFTTLLKDPEALRGKFVVFGGAIAATQNSGQGTTLEIIQYDLDSREVPDETSASLGRFLAVTPDTLNITMCRSGRLVTVAGEVAGKRVMPLKGADYSFPVISVKELHLFPLHNEEFNIWVPYTR